MERKREERNWLSQYINLEALKLLEHLWEESASFYVNFNIGNFLQLKGFEGLIFEASFAQNLAKKRAHKENFQYPLLSLIPKRFLPVGGVFQKTASLLELNVLEYIENYQENNKIEEKRLRSIIMAAHFLSSVYLENLGREEGKLKQAILAAIERSPLKKKTVQ